MAALTRVGRQPGWAWRTSAATPAVAGVAMDVPEMVVPASPPPTRVEMTETPGAATSGLTAELPLRGPPELKPASSL